MMRAIAFAPSSKKRGKNNELFGGVFPASERHLNGGVYGGLRFAAPIARDAPFGLDSRICLFRAPPHPFPMGTFPVPMGTRASALARGRFRAAAAGNNGDNNVQRNSTGRKHRPSVPFFRRHSVW